MYIQIDNDNLIAWSEKEFEGYTKEVSVDYDDFTQNTGKYIFSDGTIIKNPNWEKEQEEKEKERIARLNMTKLDFSNYLKELGVTYAQLKELLATDEEAQRQWELCERVYRFNPLLDSFAKKFGITPQQLDAIFIDASTKTGEVR